MTIIKKYKIKRYRTIKSNPFDMMGGIYLWLMWEEKYPRNKNKRLIKKLIKCTKK